MLRQLVERHRFQHPIPSIVGDFFLRWKDLHRCGGVAILADDDG